MERNKVISVEAAARVVIDGDTVATSGFVGVGFPEELALERRFGEIGSPRNLTLVYAAGRGDGIPGGAWWRPLVGRRAPVNMFRAPVVCALV